MTKEQERSIKLIERKAMDILFYGKDYEFKKFEVEENEYFVSLVFEVGAIGDEGTLAAVFCRDYGHVWIGKRGGITYPVNSKRAKNGFVRKPFKGIMGVVIDQRI